MRSFAAFMLALTLAVPSVPAFAAFEGPTGKVTITQAVQVQKAHDDEACTLEGNIIEKVAGKKDKYVFQDQSGKVIVEIDDRVFASRTVTPQTKVRLYGEVDRNKSKDNSVDVHQMEIVKE